MLSKPCSKQNSGEVFDNQLSVCKLLWHIPLTLIYYSLLFGISLSFKNIFGLIIHLKCSFLRSLYGHRLTCLFISYLEAKISLCPLLELSESFVIEAWLHAVVASAEC